jgi:hypothetical protein
MVAVVAVKLAVINIGNIPIITTITIQAVSPTIITASEVDAAAPPAATNPMAISPLLIFIIIIFITIIMVVDRPAAIYPHPIRAALTKSNGKSRRFRMPRSGQDWNINVPRSVIGLDRTCVIWDFRGRANGTENFEAYTGESIPWRDLLRLSRMRCGRR